MISLLFLVAAQVHLNQPEAHQAPPNSGAERSASDFSFSVHSADRTYSQADLRKCEKKEGGYFCSSQERYVEASMIQIAEVRGGRLQSLTVAGDIRHLGRFKQALSDRYGEPCRTSTETVTSRGGRQLESDITAWCFASGEFTLYDRFARLDQFAAIYERAGGDSGRSRPEPGF